MKTLKLLMIGLLTVSLSFSCKKKDKSPKDSDNGNNNPPTEQYSSITFTLVAFDVTGNSTSFNGPVKAYVGSDTVTVAITQDPVKPSGCAYFSSSIQLTVKTFQIKKSATTDIKFKDNSGLLGTVTVNEDGSLYNAVQAPAYTNLLSMPTCSGTRQFALSW